MLKEIVALTFVVFLFPGFSFAGAELMTEMPIRVAGWNVTKNIGQYLEQPDQVRFFGPGSCEQKNLKSIDSQYLGEDKYNLFIKFISYSRVKFCATHPVYGSETMDYSGRGRRETFTFKVYE